MSEVRHRLRLGLRQKLIVLVLVILVPLLALLGFNLYNFFRTLEQAEVALHTRDARIIAGDLDRFIQSQADIGRTSGLAISQGRVTGPAADRYLRSVAASNPISSIAYAAPDGRVTAAWPPSLKGRELITQPGFLDILAGAPYSAGTLRRDVTGDLAFDVFAPVFSGGKLVAVTQVAVDARNLGLILPSSITHGVVFVTDERGALVYSNRAELSGLTEAQRRQWSSPGGKTVTEGTEFSSASTPLQGLGGGWLGAQVRSPESGWTVGLFDPSGSALAVIASEVGLNVAVILLVLTVSLLAARQYGHAITGPVESLTAATTEIERGQFDAEVPVTTSDEIGELAVNFKHMQDSLKRTIGDVQVLSESARWMSSTLDLESIGRATSDYLEKIIGANAVTVTLFEDGRPGPEPRVIAPHLDPEAAEELSTLGAAAAEGIDPERTGYVVEEVEPSPQLSVAGHGAHTLVVLPLVVNRKLIGHVDALASPTAAPAEFVAADVPLAASLAQQVAAAAENARNFEQQRAIADTLQDALLTRPYRVPELDVGLIYHQATVGARIGGDFYDFIPVSVGFAAVVIGDISGKGLDAARFTALGKGAIRSFAFDDPDPASVFNRATRVISEQIGIANFITSIYVLIDLKTGDVTYANAGHPPPIVYRAETGTAELLPGGGVPLGIDVPDQYTDCRAKLAPGDRLLLYTDGLSEARRGLELFGIERVREAFVGFSWVPVRDVASSIAESAIAFAGGELGDDLAIIALERCASPRGAGTTR